MTIEEYLKDELKRLNRMNDLLEKELNQSNINNLAKEEQIKSNALAMCEIAKACKNYFSRGL